MCKGDGKIVKSLVQASCVVARYHRRGAMHDARCTTHTRLFHDSNDEDIIF